MQPAAAEIECMAAFGDGPGAAAEARTRLGQQAIDALRVQAPPRSNAGRAAADDCDLGLVIRHEEILAVQNERRMTGITNCRGGVYQPPVRASTARVCSSGPKSSAPSIDRTEEHTSELQSPYVIPYAVFR